MSVRLPKPRTAPLPDLLLTSYLLVLAPEFIHLISSEANEACEATSKKTISPEHVVTALKSLGFETYIEECEGVLDEHKEHQKVRLYIHSEI